MTLAISVIIPNRNSGRDLGELIDALAAQTLPREQFEVVIGDDGSTDGSSDHLAGEDDWLKVAAGAPLNSYAARNRAAAVARAPVLAFCDSDCRPTPEWLAAGLAEIEHADLVAGAVRFRIPPRRTVWTILDIDMFLDQERAVAAGRATTANLFVRREIFRFVGGFDDSLPSGGDYDFVARCVTGGGKLVFASRALVWHPTRDNRADFFRKLWRTQRAAGARAGSRRQVPSGVRLLVPVVVPLWLRWRGGKSIRPDRRRLAENGVRPSATEDAQCLLALYGLIPYVSAVAQLSGWVRGRRAARSATPTRAHVA